MIILMIYRYHLLGKEDWKKLKYKYKILYCFKEVEKLGGMQELEFILDIFILR